MQKAPNAFGNALLHMLRGTSTRNVARMQIMYGKLEEIFEDQDDD